MGGGESLNGLDLDDAYERLSATVAEEVLATCSAAPDWRTGFRTAVAAFMNWVAANPAEARLLLVERRAADGRAAGIHRRICERLERAIDGARNAEGAERDPPALAPALILGAIEFAAADHVMRGAASSAPMLVDGIAHIAALLYFGEAAAEEEPD